MTSSGCRFGTDTHIRIVARLPKSLVTRPVRRIKHGNQALQDYVRPQSILAERLVLPVKDLLPPLYRKS